MITSDSGWTLNAEVDNGKCSHITTHSPLPLTTLPFGDNRKTTYNNTSYPANIVTAEFGNII